MPKVIINEEQFAFLTKHKYLELDDNHKIHKFPKDKDLLEWGYDLWVKTGELAYTREEVSIEVKQYNKRYKIVQEG